MTSKGMLESLKLFRDKAFINGQWIGSASAKTFTVYNPSSQKPLGEVADLSQEETTSAITSAHEAFQTWGRTSCRKRSNILLSLGAKMKERADDFAKIMALECGKPLQEAHGEVAYAASFFDWFAAEALRLDGDIQATAHPSQRNLVLRQPVGVAGMITPWNFPLAMVTRKVGPALAAGCTTVVKPSEETPYSALAVAALAEEVGLPPGVLNVVTCSKQQAVQVGEAISQSHLVQKVSFTGSTGVGKLLLSQCAPTVKRISMELGGNAPFIVFNSADARLAADRAVTARFRNNGQTCICPQRFLVQDDIYDSFLSELHAAVAKLSVGDPMSGNATQGPLINQQGLDKVERHVTDAVAKGADVVIGGNRTDREGYYFDPTILTRCDDSMLVAQEETFGPVAALFRFSTEEEAVRIANDTKSGLAGYFFSNDHRQIWRVAEALEVGMVGVNENAISGETTPFGGVKESGIGREGSRYGIDEFTNMKFICLGGL